MWSSYFAPSGHYAASPYYFYTPPPTGGQHHQQPAAARGFGERRTVNGAFASANGVCAYSSTSTFPTTSYEGTNYWVDPVFMPATTAPGQVTNVSATAGNRSAHRDAGARRRTAAGRSRPTRSPPTSAPKPSHHDRNRDAAGNQRHVSGLTAGASYTFTVQASNPNGSGPASEPSNAVTPATTGAALGADGRSRPAPRPSQALVSWSAPRSNGGSPITSYTVTPYVGRNRPDTRSKSRASATSTTVKGLDQRHTYTFTVTASNATGQGPPSGASAAVTPQDTIFDFATPATIDSGDGERPPSSA